MIGVKIITSFFAAQHSFISNPNMRHEFHINKINHKNKRVEQDRANFPRKSAQPTIAFRQTKILISRFCEILVEAIVVLDATSVWIIAHA